MLVVGLRLVVSANKGHLARLLTTFALEHVLRARKKVIDLRLVVPLADWLSGIGLPLLRS